MSPDLTNASARSALQCHQTAPFVSTQMSAPYQASVLMENVSIPKAPSSVCVIPVTNFLQIEIVASVSILVDSTDFNYLLRSFLQNLFFFSFDVIM